MTSHISDIERIQNIARQYEAEHYDPRKGERSYGFILYCEQTFKFLLTYEHNRWEFPKGHRNDGETPLEAAIRELYEETNVTLENPTVDGIFSVEFTKNWSLKRLKQTSSYEGERPDWNNVGKIKRVYVFFLVKIKCELKSNKQSKFVSLHDCANLLVKHKSVTYPILVRVARMLRIPGYTTLKVKDPRLNQIWNKLKPKVKTYMFNGR